MAIASWVKTARRKAVLAALATGMILTLSACGGETAPATPMAGQTPLSAANPTPQTPKNPVQPKNSNQAGVSLSEWALLPNNMGLPSGKVTLNVTNKGEFSHNLVVKNGNSEVGRTPNFTKADGTKSIDLNLQPGTYTMLCDIPGHAGKGMTGTLTVTK